MIVVPTTSSTITPAQENYVLSLDSQAAAIVTDQPSYVISAGDTNVSNVMSADFSQILIAVAAQGIQGPEGPLSEEDMPYARQVDFVSDTLLYRGEASVGSLSSAPFWRIRKITFAVDGDVSETWANGSALFNQVWDNRASLPYS